MNETKKEQLSAFMDNEIDGSQKDLVDDLLQEPELLDTWSRYHLISDSLKQGLPESVDRNLARNVSEALRDEPAILAPGRLAHPLLKPVAGFAIAASVTALAILGVQQQQLDGPHETPQGSLVQSTPGGGGNVRAPVRQVSSASAGIIAECDEQATQDGQADADKRQQAAGSGPENGEAGRNCP